MLTNTMSCYEEILVLLMSGNLCNCNVAKQDLLCSSPPGKKWNQCETVCRQTAELNPRRLTQRLLRSPAITTPLNQHPLCRLTVARAWLHNKVLICSQMSRLYDQFGDCASHA